MSGARGKASREVLSNLTVAHDGTILDALKRIDRNAKSIVFVCEKGGKVIGSLTDGDLRRAILGGSALDARCLRETMRQDFISVGEDVGRVEVLELMRARGVEQIPVLDESGHLRGLHTMRELIAPLDRPNVALVLAGGRGTRLHPLTEKIPKPMLEVAGRPILERLVLHLMSGGFHHIYIAVNYLADVITDHFGDGSSFGCSIEYLRETTPLGTGGALSLLPAQQHSVLVINGDLVTQCDLGRLLDFHEREQFAATVGVRPHSITVPYGVATMDGGKLADLTEKPTMRMLINAGVYVVAPATIELIPRGVDFPITDLLNRCRKEGRPVGAHVIDDDWVDVGNHAELQLARGDI